jgi:hypothetical protein
MAPAPARGIGRGGRRPGARRPPGSVSKESKALIADARRGGLMPVGFLLEQPDPPGTVVPRAARQQTPETAAPANNGSLVHFDLATRRLERPR